MNVLRKAMLLRLGDEIVGYACGHGTVVGLELRSDERIAVDLIYRDADETPRRDRITFAVDGYAELVDRSAVAVASLRDATIS